MDSHLLCLPGQRPALTAPGAAQEGHRQPAALPPPCRCPGIRQASDGPQRATGGTQRLPCPAGALASAQLQTAQEGTRCAPWRPASAPPVKSVSADGFEAPQGPAAAPLSCRVSWHPPSSDGSRSGPGGPQPARSNSAALTVHRGPGGPLASCSPSAALSCPNRTPPPGKSARGCGFGPTWTQPPAFISIRVKFVYLHKHENP